MLNEIHKTQRIFNTGGYVVVLVSFILSKPLLLLIVMLFAEENL